MDSNLLRIATRSSPMALAQVERVRRDLAAVNPAVEVEVVPIKTTGDRWMGDLREKGGKGAFIKEVDRALAAGLADLAVHCLKDMPGDIPVPAGMTIAGYMTRDSIHEALIHPAGLTLDQLPAGTRIGTSSVRRRAQLAAHRPDLECVPMRGNANRRLEKLYAGDADALILAVCGLERIDRTDVITEQIDPAVMCPPVGAGILALQCREDDTETLDAVAPLNDPTVWQIATAERTFLHVLQGSCHSPIGGHAWFDDDGELHLRGEVYSYDGKKELTAVEPAGALDPAGLGTSVALAVLKEGARDLLDAL
ncbi:hydroxymethylbilane synthase [Salininema proteolyticum]|uniref:Porphobilinogen deaminase n=1 Tax=Salininema proteolyticum TaxID=1607685 RepID=A0ABV8TUD7_9ACTN